MAFVPVMMAVSAAATVAAAGISAYAAMRQGQAQKQIYDYQAAVAKINADHTKEVGQREALPVGEKYAQDIAFTRKTFGGGNLNVDSGSPAEVRKSQSALGYFDQQTVMNNAAWRAYGSETQGALYTTAGVEARTAGNISATASLISGAGKAAGMFAQGQSTGIFGSTDSPFGFNPVEATTSGRQMLS